MRDWSVMKVAESANGQCAMKEDKIKYMFALYRASCEDNRMKAVAMLFGKKLGEEFTVRGEVGEYRAHFNESGFMVRTNENLWYANSLLVDLLTGEVEIIDD